MAVKKTKKKISGKDKKTIDKSALDRDDKPMSIVGHLNELRSRLLKSIITISVVTIAGFFFFSEYVLDLINKPFIKTGFKLNVFTLSEGFMLRVKASLLAGLFIGVPVIVYEIWKYIRPAINRKDRKFIGKLIISAIFLLYAGVILTYLFLLPIGIQMLLMFTPDYMNNMVQASKYLNFALLFGLAVGILCELPIVILILTNMGILTPAVLVKKRKYAIVLIWIAAGILTPGPDVLSQTLVAIPIMFLYEISIIISKVMVKRKLKQDR